MLLTPLSIAAYVLANLLIAATIASRSLLAQELGPPPSEYGEAPRANQRSAQNMHVPSTNALVTSNVSGVPDTQGATSSLPPAAAAGTLVSKGSSSRGLRTGQPVCASTVSRADDSSHTMTASVARAPAAVANGTPTAAKGGVRDDRREGSAKASYPRRAGGLASWKRWIGHVLTQPRRGRVGLRRAKTPQRSSSLRSDSADDAVGVPAAGVATVVLPAASQSPPTHPANELPIALPAKPTELSVARAVPAAPYTTEEVCTEFIS